MMYQFGKWAGVSFAGFALILISPEVVMAKSAKGIRCVRAVTQPDGSYVMKPVTCPADLSKYAVTKYHVDGHGNYTPVDGGDTAPVIPRHATHRQPVQNSKPPKVSTGDQQGPDNSDLLPGATCGSTGSAASFWDSVQHVSSDGVIPKGQGYNINSPDWPKLQESGGKMTVYFGPRKSSMCTSATAAAFYQNIADLVNSGKLHLTSDEVTTLNSHIFRNALNGNTWSVADLYQYIGGQSMKATNTSSIRAALQQAKAGDILKFDRKSGTGHSTVFKELKGDSVCYWSSNTATRGVGEKCESISKIADLAVSRFPQDLGSLPSRLDALAGNTKVAARFKSSLSAHSGNIAWSNNLTCKGGGGNYGKAVATIH